MSTHPDAPTSTASPAPAGPTLTGRPALWTRDFTLLLAISASFYMGFQILLAPMPLYVVHLGGDAAAAGLVTGLFTLTALLVRPFTGWALDVYGRRAVLVLGTAFCLALILAQEWAVTLGALIALRMVHGLGFGFATTATGTIAADLVPRPRLGEGMGFYAITMGLPLGIAPPIGFWLAGRGQYSALFWLAAATTGVSLVLALVVRVPRPARTRTVGARARIQSMFVRSAVFPSGLMFLLISSFGLILALLAIFGRERGIGSVGVWFTLYAVVLTLSRGVAGRSSDRFGYPQTATVGFVFAVAGLLVMASAHSVWVLLLSAVVYGMGYGTAQPCLQAMLVARTPVARIGAATAFFFFAYDLGTTVGSVGGGFLAGLLGLGSVFALSAVAPLLALGLLVAHLRKARRAAAAVVG
ncbi:MAG: MFS transporter [Thermoleophilia bacterium]